MTGLLTNERLHLECLVNEVFVSKPIRLLCCSSTMEGGGSERQLVNLIRGLDRTRVAPSLFLLDRKGALLEEIPADTPVDSYWQQRRPSRFYFPGRISISQSHAILQAIGQHQCEVVYDRLFHMALVTGSAARRARVARVATIVSPPEQDLIRTESRFVWLKRWTLARSYRSATRLLAVSEGTADSASRFYNIPRSRFEVIPSPVDLERIDNLCKEEVIGGLTRMGRQKLISIGRLSEEKGHACLVKALSITNRQSDLDLELHLVGDGPLKRNLQEQASNEGIADRVFFHGQLANPFPFLNQADLFCLPSLYEGLPNALLEAMAVGIPVLASDCPGGIREVTLNGTLCELVNRGDPVAWAHSIRRHFENKAPALNRVALARQKIEQFHSLSTWVRKMEEIFIEACG